MSEYGPPTGRRLFLKALAGLAAMAAVPVYAGELEPRWLELERRDVGLPGLPGGFDGLRVAQLTDLHRGPTTGIAEIRRAVQVSMEQEPELIVLTGDYVTRSAEFADELPPVLALLSAPLGVYGALGNHDHWTDARHVSQRLEQGGVRVLRNESVLLQRGGDTVRLAAVDDIMTGRNDLVAALGDETGGPPAILLAHEPDYADEVVAQAPGWVLLQLSGHTHGGQFRFMGDAPVLPRLGKKYVAGLYRVGRMAVYVSRGIGTTTIGMRLNCRPEVTLLTLRAGTA